MARDPSKRSGKKNRSWGGRFRSGPAADAQNFTASIGFDIRLYPYDVRASTAHANMLAATGIITKTDRNKIVRGLAAIEKELDKGTFVPETRDEDIHMAIERRLIEKIGAPGAKLHSARSRNDQVVTDVRLFLRDAIDAIDAALEDAQRTLVAVACKHDAAVLPGYTHLQRAQPVLLAHHLLAYHDMLERDRERLADCRRRTNRLPLGAGALAGTTLPIDRAAVARELEFDGLIENSLDAVADRDFIAEFLAWAAILFAHLSRLAGEITLWVSSEFGFAKLHDAYSTGSSMMPQKKNPDIAELVRGKSGRVYGNLMSMLTTLKGLPLAYNSDLQEDKEPLFDSVDTTLGSLGLIARLLESLAFDEAAMLDAADDSLLLATDVAEFLVGRGVPFRDAHEIAGEMVAESLRSGKPLTALSEDELIAASPALDGADKILSTQASVRRRQSAGGTSGRRVGPRLKKLAKRYGL